MLVDAPQSLHAQAGAELVEHPGGGTVTPQPCEPPPCRLFGQLRDEEIERTGHREQRQQMHPPELRRTESVAATAGAFAREKLSDEVIGHVIVEHFEQRVCSNRRQRGCHAGTLTPPYTHDTSLVSA